MKGLRFRSGGIEIVDTECTDRDGGVVVRFDPAGWVLTARGVGLLGHLLNDWNERQKAETEQDQAPVPPGVVTGKFRQLHDYAEELRQHFASILNDQDEPKREDPELTCKVRWDESQKGWRVNHANELKARVTNDPREVVLTSRNHDGDWGWYHEGSPDTFWGLGSLERARAKMAERGWRILREEP